MIEDRIEGDAKAAKGSIKEAIGKIVGNETTEAEGAAEKAADKAQADAGKARTSLATRPRKDRESEQ